MHAPECCTVFQGLQSPRIICIPRDASFVEDFDTSGCNGGVSRRKYFCFVTNHPLEFHRSDDEPEHHFVQDRTRGMGARARPSYVKEAYDREVGIFLRETHSIE